MSSGAAVIGLTYDGTDIQQADYGIFLEIVRGLNEPPQVRGIDTVVPGLPGRVPRNRVVDVLTLELRGFVTGDGRAAFRANAATVRALFYPTNDPAVLVATLEDGSTATITARALPTQLWGQVVPEFATVSIELESVDPDWEFETS